MKHSNLLAGIISAVIGTVSLLSVMIDTGIPHSTFAQAASLEDLTFTVYSDSATVLSCSEAAEGKITIPSEYNGVPVTTIAELSFSSCHNITSIVLPDSIESIGKSAFFNCNQLEEINIPQKVQDIPYHCFYSCCSLETIIIPSNVKNVNIDAFTDVPLTKVQILNPNLDISFMIPPRLKSYPLSLSGYAGSTVEALAKTRGIPFELIEGAVETTTTRAPQVTTTHPYSTKPRIQKSLIKYDMNGDNSVNIADAVLLTRFLSEENVNISRTGNPDINGDGVVTIEDVQAMLKALKPFYLKIGKTSAKPGEKVSIPVQVYGDKGTAAGQVYISYDSRLTPVSLKIGDAYTGSFDYEADSFPIYLAWTSQNGLEQTAKDGATLATIEFEVDPNIKQTEYLEIRVMDSGQDYTRFSDSDGFVFTASYRSGYITVIP